MKLTKLLVFSIFLFIIPFAFSASPGQPCGYRGTVTIDGDLSSDAVVDAYIGSALRGTTFVGEYSEEIYSMSVKKPDSETSDDVTFKVWGITADTATFDALEIIDLDLEVDKVENGDECPSDYTGIDTTNSHNYQHEGCDGGYCVWEECWENDWKEGDDNCDDDFGESNSNSADCRSGSGGGGGGGAYTPVENTTEEPVVIPVITPPIIPAQEAPAIQLPAEQIAGEAPVAEEQPARGVINDFNKNLGINEVYSFTVNGESHTATVLELNESGGTVRIRVESSPQFFLLSIGQEVSVDLNGDSLTDLMIKLVEIKNKKANLAFKEIGVVSAKETAKEEKAVTITPGSASAKKASTVPLGAGAIALIALGAFAVIFLFVSRSKKKKKKR
jgi:hypothetical protein